MDVKAIFANYKKEDVAVYYDGPMAFASKDDSGTWYFLFVCGDDEYLAAECSSTKAEDLKGCRTTPRAFFQEAHARGRLFVVKCWEDDPPRRPLDSELEGMLPGIFWEGW